MFNLIRRISYGVIARPDRPWEEDATSNAPNTRRKRRLSSVERDVDADEDPVSKKTRAESATPSVGDNLSSPVAEHRAETPAVKEVTKGVKEVDLEDNLESAQATTAPERVPLPDENAGELDEPSSDDDCKELSSSAGSRPLEAEDDATLLVDGKDSEVDDGAKSTDVTSATHDSVPENHLPTTATKDETSTDVNDSPSVANTTPGA